MATSGTIGVYRIRNVRTGAFYIGSSSRVERRWRYHKWELRRGVHGNRYLQRAWIKHGESAFVFEVLETIVDASALRQAEQRWLDRCGSKQRYNVIDIAGHPPHSADAIARMVATRRARGNYAKSPAQREAQRLRMLGKKLPLAVRAKMSAARAGRRRPEMVGIKRAWWAELSDTMRRDIGASISAALKGRLRGIA